MEQYFIIAESDGDKRQVIEVVENRTDNESVRVSQWIKGDTKQLWMWTKGMIRNKFSDLVLNVMGEKKDEGTDVIVSSAKETLNQKWRIEDGMIRSFSGEDLNITKRKNGFLGVWHSGDYVQKWRLVPEAMSDAYELYLQNDNPLLKAMFSKTTLLEHLDCILGSTIEHYEINLNECVSIGNECANKLDEMAKITGNVKKKGGITSIIGGSIALTGMLLAPFTAGLSLTMTVGGGALATGGGIISVSAVIAEFGYNDDDIKKLQNLMEDTIQKSTGLRHLLLEVCKDLEKANQFLSAPKGKTYLEDLTFYVNKGGYVATNVVVCKKGLDAIKAIKEMKALAAFIQANVYAVKTLATGAAEANAVKAVASGAADAAAAGRLLIPIAGKSLVKASLAGVKALSSAVSVLGIIFGIFDAVDGAKRISEGSSQAKELRKSTEEINKEVKELIKTYHDLSEEN